MKKDGVMKMANDKKWSRTIYAFYFVFNVTDEIFYTAQNMVNILTCLWILKILMKNQKSMLLEE
jgi:hypothetical protein